MRLRPRHRLHLLLLRRRGVRDHDGACRERSILVSSSDYKALLRQQLSQFISAQFGPGTPAGAIRDGVLSHPGLAAIDRSDLLAGLDDILAELAAVPSAAVVRPRLLVDWGEMPQIGRSARPLFSLIGAGSSGRPSVRVNIDRGLDHDPVDPLRQVRTEESGLWTFYVPFSLTTNGLDSRPGLYVIDVDVTFPNAGDGQPRFLRTQIRLNLSDGSSDRRELVIDGDGQSVVNLAGHDLRSFSRVVLKGDDQAIINLQSFSQEVAALPEKPRDPVVFEYELKINRDIQERLPRIVPVSQPAKVDAITLAIDGHRVHVIARKRVTFGRSRENDVCLRFLPRSKEYDEGSRGISRTHMALDLTENGLMLVDEKSAKGVDVDCDSVRGDKTFTHLDAPGGRHIDLPSPLSASIVLEMDLALFGQDPRNPDFRTDLEWDDVCFEVAGEPASRPWQIARTSGMEAARLRRLNNLSEEEYVFLYRHARIGRSAKDHAIAISGLGAVAGDLRLLYAGRMFWLHSEGSVAITLNGERIDGACLMPLAIGQAIGIAGTTMRVGRFQQFGLDDEGSSAASGASGSMSAAETAGLRSQSCPTLDPGGSPPVAPMGVVNQPRPSVQFPPPPPPPRQREQLPPPDVDSSSDDPIRAALGSVAVIAGMHGHGSGFMAAPGVLATNYHVIADSIIDRLSASFPDNRAIAGVPFPLRLLHEDPANDLAYLRVEADIPPLRLKPGFVHRNGHRIVAIGSPGLGFGGEKLENLSTDGRLGPVYRDDSDAPELWALSMAVNPGNSGGPVLDAETGEVLAVVVAKFTATEGHGLAVPFDVFSRGLGISLGLNDAGLRQIASLHRQRYCLRTIGQFVNRFDEATRRMLAECDGLAASGGDMIHSYVNSFTSGFGCEAANEVGMIKTSLIGELSLLRDDGCCSSDRCDRLERAWGGLERLARQISAEVGRLEVDIFTDEVRTALERSRCLLDALQSELTS